jgi:RecA-family ATPase
LTGEVVHCQGKVWIHNNEDSLDELYRRTGGILKYHGIDLTTVRENIFVTSGLDEPLVVAIKEKDLVRRQQAVAEVIKSIKKKGIQHIAVDPFVSTHRGVSENSNEEIEQVVDCFRAVAHETGCSIDLIHHSLKPQNKSSEALAGDMNAARGASSLAGAVRMLYTVLPMGKKTAEDMNVPGDLAARLVRLDLYRSNGSHTAVTGAPLCTSGPKKDAWAKRRSCRDPTNRSTALVVSISLSAPK